MTDRVAIIDYGAGNLRSAQKAFSRAAEQSPRAIEIVVTSDSDIVRQSSHLVLPGQGAFADCRAGLDRVPGMIAALTEAVHHDGRPFFGICVGMQLLADCGHEHRATGGLGWISGDVTALDPDDPALKIPHMGWNSLIFRDGSDVVRHPVLSGLRDGDHVYFVHSYAFCRISPAHLLARCDYGGPVAAIVGRDTIIGTQFHPEKSQRAGLRMIENFLNWRP